MSCSYIRNNQKSGCWFMVMLYTKHLENVKHPEYTTSSKRWGLVLIFVCSWNTQSFIRISSSCSYYRRRQVPRFTVPNELYKNITWSNMVPLGIKQFLGKWSLLVQVACKWQNNGGSDGFSQRRSSTYVQWARVQLFQQLWPRHVMTSEEKSNLDKEETSGLKITAFVISFTSWFSATVADPLTIKRNQCEHAEANSTDTAITENNKFRDRKCERRKLSWTR